jgi:hypothetical protein
MKALAVLIVFAACDPPPMKLRYRLTEGPSQVCPSTTGGPATDCSQYTMLCRGVLSIRIVPPEKTDIPYASSCTRLTSDRPDDRLCSIASIDVPQASVAVPEQVLEVQVAIFEEGTLDRDVNGNPICPQVKYGADNLALSAVEACIDGEPCPAQPAIAGRAFYYPGDDKTIVELGCVNESLLSTCNPIEETEVQASVFDFETVVSVSPATAPNLFVSAAEPTLNNLLGAFWVDPADTYPLQLIVQTPDPKWATTIMTENPDVLRSSACVKVLENIPQATSTLTCTAPVPPSPMDLLGYRLPRATLNQILLALGRPVFPDTGLVVGVVLNQFFSPVPGVVVSSDAGTIKYLSADRASVNTTSTSSNGIFISEDAPYGTKFTWSGVEQIGGVVTNHVTIVVLQKPIEPF